MIVSEELELILRLGPDFDGDFDALVEAAQGNGWESDDARWIVTMRLGQNEFPGVTLHQVAICDGQGAGAMLVQHSLNCSHHG